MQWDVNVVCLAYAPVVSWVVEFLKRFPVFKRYPKLVVLLLGVAIPLLQQFTSPGHALPLSQILECALLTLGGAIFTHEVITEPLQRTVAKP